MRVRSPQPAELRRQLQERGFIVEQIDGQELQVEDGTAEQIGELAHHLGIPLHHLSDVQQSLEEAFLELTGDSVDYHGRAMEVAP